MGIGSDGLFKGLEGQFAENEDIYKYVNTEMRNGLKRIFKEINDASSFKQSDIHNTDEIFDEASVQLSAIIESTEEVTFQIMDVLERRLVEQEETMTIISELKIGKINWARLERLEKINLALSDDLTEVMTALSFQDLTGQRIKKVVNALTQIEKIIIELYVGSALLVKRREAAPDTDISVIEKEVQRTVQNLKKDASGSVLNGPQNTGVSTSQADIDDLLAQLGM